MLGNNPYAQGGWYNPQNPYSINGEPRAQSSRAPTFGALPPSLHSSTSSVLEFEFTNLNPDLFNCLVIGPQQRKFFEVKTSNNTTAISKPGDTFALIKWDQHPFVEAKGVLSIQRTRDFLKLSADSTYRTMIIGGRAYIWVPSSNGIYLYSGGPNPPEQFARISLTSDNTNLLEITSDAFQAGLFEPCIISTVLLLSGRNID